MERLVEAIHAFFSLFLSWFGALLGLLYAHFFATLGVGIGFFIILRILREKRNPSNIYAWSLAVILVPWAGVPLFLLFGGRKSRRWVRIKKEVMEAAIRRAESETMLSLPIQHWAVTPDAGNKVELLRDGVEAFEALIAGIEQAEETIDCMTYIFGRDAVADAVVDKLEERARAGVQVRLLVDAFGSMGKVARIRRRLAPLGAQVVRFLPLLALQSHSSANLRNHRKLTIFDRKVCIAGGQNIDRRFIGPVPDPELFVDFSLRYEGPVLRAFNFVFAADWVFSAGEKIETVLPLLHFQPERVGDSLVEVIESGPEIEGDPLYTRILLLVQDCRESLTIVTPYFLPDDTLFHSLVVKALSGRAIRLILPMRSNHRLVDLASYHRVRELSRAGVRVLFYEPGMIHGKLMIVDEEIAMTGSANFDQRSLFLNFEIGIFQSSPSDVAALQQWAEALIPKTIPFEESEWKEPKGRERYLESFAHLFVPLL
ncbi:MAG: phospholipase D-like domain-containing protein [Puniceicoccaceae bacterium]